MNDAQLSALIREAKPLYLARQRKRDFFCKLSVSACVFAVALLTFLYQPLPRETSYNDYWTEEIQQAQNGSVIEDMGLPVDEFGLLWVG